MRIEYDGSRSKQTDKTFSCLFGIDWDLEELSQDRVDFG